MTQSRFTYTYGTGRLRGTKFEVGVRHDPTIDDVESFAAVLFFTMSGGRRVEIAKVDDSEHDADAVVHVDRYYREIGAEIKDFAPDEDVDDWVDAEDYLRENWKRFASTYVRNHGVEPRADGVNVGSN